MKKILSVLLIMVAVIAFSGLATATPVSATKTMDKGSKTVYYNDGTTVYYNWHLLYYSSTHCKLYLTIKQIPLYPFKFIVTCDFKKISKKSIKVRSISYFNGKKGKTEILYVKTSKSTYKYFKSRKNGILNYFESKLN